MTIELAVILLIALLLTILIELGVLLLMGERQKRVLWLSAFVNVLTNVPLNLSLFYLEADDMTVLVGELVVVAVEALAYSVLCNAISFLAGLLLLLLFVTLLHSY